MKFDRKLLPRIIGPLEIGLWIVATLAVILFTFIGVNVIRSRRAQALNPPTPSATLTVGLSPTLTITPMPSASPTVGSTNTLVVEPTLEPTATQFYVVPANPTPIPTPDLPPAAPFPASCDGPGRMNLLVIGIDGFNADNNRPARADTIMLVGANFAAKSAQLLSFPRDLWVQLPGITDPPAARINTAYHYGEYYQVPGGGPEELRATIAGTFNLRLDRYVVVNFLAFEQGVDAIGGVDLDLPAPLQDASYPLRDGSGTIAVNFPAGPIHMDGATALIYARIRHDSNDINRMKRQQQVLFAIRDKLLAPETIPQLPALAQVLLSAVRTDLTLDDIALLGCLGPQINREAIQAWVIDTTMVTPTKFADGAQVLLPNMDAIAPILEAFNTGE